MSMTPMTPAEAPPASASRHARASIGDYLGPAHVVEATDGAGAVRVELPDGAVVTATLALAIPYETAPGDVLLVIGKDGSHFVIGVIHGAGRSALRLQGDVELRAAGGALRLSGDKGVCIEGPEVDIRADKLRMVAGAVAQRFTSVVQRVSALLSVHAGQAQTVIEEGSFTRAKTAAILTEETMTINGKQIHLG